MCILVIMGSSDNRYEREVIILKLEQMIIDSMRGDSKSKVQVPEREQLLLYLHGLMLFTGRTDIMFCNDFLNEAIQLLINSIFLYEDGYYDCAFYSIRQTSEVLDSMLYLSNKEQKTMKSWSAKEKFPTDAKIKSELEKLSYGYKEMKELLLDYFEYHSDLIKKSHKIIHKQGFDTFYRIRNGYWYKHGFSQKNEVKLYVETLKYTIGKSLIIFIILDPISLALADEKITYKLNFNFLAEPVDISFFEKFLGLSDIIPKILESNYYQDFITEFSKKEVMQSAVFSVVREQAWYVESLNEIEDQLHLLDVYERFMFCVLKCGVQVSNFYYNGGLIWYFTSIKSNYHRSNYGGEEFQNYLKSDNYFNQSCGNVYMSVLTMYNEPLYIEHNNMFSKDEINTLRAIEFQGIQKFRQFNAATNDLGEN